MCHKPQQPRPIPEATAALVTGLFDNDSVYQFIGEVLFDQFYDEDFVNLFLRHGSKQGISALQFVP